MLSLDDRNEVLNLIRSELEITEMVHHPGSYTHLCILDGVVILTHMPVGQVLRRL